MNQESRIQKMMNRLNSESKSKKVSIKQIKALIKNGATIITKEGEIVNIRVYADGWTKLTGPNIYKQFTSQQEAYDFLKPDLK